MKSSLSWRVYWILMILSVAIMTAHQIWNAQRPSDEEVQRRMQEGLESQRLIEEARKLELGQDGVFGTHGDTNRESND